MANVLIAKMTEKGSYYTTCELCYSDDDFDLDTMDNRINVKMKIDTGCFRTVIPLRSISRYRFDDDYLMELKLNDIINNVKSIRSFGIETGANRPTEDPSIEGRMQDKLITFYHRISKMKLGNYDIGDKVVRFSYDRTGIALLGMDILSQMDIHIGRDIKTGVNTLIGCLYRDADSPEYREILRNMLGITYI